MIEFDLLNVDSLNAFLIPYDSADNEALKTKFKFTNDSFLIENPLEEDGPNELTTYGEIIPFYINFNFPKKIKRLETDLKFIQKSSNDKIEIKSNLNEISYGKGFQRLEVFFLN